MPADFEPIEPRYLGDAVYASFDGYHIWLGLSRHDSRVIALEPPVFEALVDYAEHIQERLRDHHNKTLAEGPDGAANPKGGS